MSTNTRLPRVKHVACGKNTVCTIHNSNLDCEYMMCTWCGSTIHTREEIVIEPVKK